MRLSDRHIPERVVLHIDHAASLAQRKAFIERIVAILPHLNWRTHFFVAGEGPPDELGFARQIIQALARFLVEHPFVSLYVHPLIRIGPSDGSDSARWEEMLDLVRPFQQQAYEQQTEARLLILPIVDPVAGTADREWMEAAQFFLDRVAKPSVLFRGSAASERARAAAGQEIRFYIEPDEGSGAQGLIRQLWMTATRCTPASTIGASTGPLEPWRRSPGRLQGLREDADRRHAPDASANHCAP
jgi:hypothetical protein